MSVKLANALPKGSQNGLIDHAASMADGLGETYIVVGIAYVAKTEQDFESEDSIPTLKMRAVEAFERDTPNGQELARILRTSYERRTGNRSLPLQLDEDDGDE